MLLQNLLEKLAKYFYALCFFGLATSCAMTEEEPLTKTSQPTTYYSQPPYQPQQYQPQYQPAPQQYPQQYQQQPAPYYYPPQQQQQPAYYQPAPRYQQPQGGSRYYSNPYAIPPSSQYPNYDADQYYVPPTYYNNIETPSQAQQKILSGTGTF